MSKVIKVVQKSVKVSLPKRFFDDLRKGSSDGLKGISDKKILDALAEDILNRYFNEEYFDLDSVLDSLR